MLLLQTNLKTKRRNFSAVTKTFAAASPDVIHRVLERVVRGDYKMAYEVVDVLPLWSNLSIVDLLSFEVVLRKDFTTEFSEIVVPRVFE
jgi:hypothetical protein